MLACPNPAVDRVRPVDAGLIHGDTARLIEVLASGSLLAGNEVLVNIEGAGEVRAADRASRALVHPVEVVAVDRQAARLRGADDEVWIRLAGAVNPRPSDPAEHLVTPVDISAVDGDPARRRTGPASATKGSSGVCPSRPARPTA